MRRLIFSMIYFRTKHPSHRVLIDEICEWAQMRLVCDLVVPHL